MVGHTWCLRPITDYHDDDADDVVGHHHIDVDVDEDHNFDVDDDAVVSPSCKEDSVSTASLKMKIMLKLMVMIFIFMLMLKKMVDNVSDEKLSCKLEGFGFQRATERSG